MIRVALLACCCCLGLGRAIAQDMAVFGLTIGKPLNLPECQFEPAGQSKIYSGSLQPVTCLEENRTPDETVHARILRFSSADMPQVVKDGYAILVEARGDLIGFQFSTYGLQYQEAVLGDLESKYGKPTSLRKSTAQNGFGASFGIIHAAWKFKPFKVTFDGADDELDEGTVTIDMPEAAKARATWEAAALNRGKKL